MLPQVVALLACPHCGGELRPVGREALRCPTGHAFDVARQGYVNLRGGDARAATGDTAHMVEARAAFLAAGHFAPITRAVTEASRTAGCAGVVVDLGAGPGHHLARVLDALPAGVGLALDASKHAARRAARAHPRAGAVVCDAWRTLPVRTGVAGLVLSVFAPRNGPEIARVLAPGGAAVVVTPTRRHLAELVPTLGLLGVEVGKRERLEAQLAPHLTRASEQEHDVAMTLGHEDVARLVAMGPSAWHVDPEETRRRIARLPEPLEVTASVTLATFRPAPGTPPRGAAASGGGTRPRGAAASRGAN